MRIIFMGTPQFAVAPLDALVRAGHEIACVYTQPPAPAGRGKRLRPSPVHQRAEELGLEVRTPRSLKSAEEQARFAALGADVAVVAAYGLILRPQVLAAPKKGCINIHASLLPRWRGAAPIHRAVMAGDEETGITIMQMDEGLDTGPMLARRATTIGEKTTGDLIEELARIGAELIVETLARLDSITPQSQDEALATYAPKIDKAEAHIDWNRKAFAVQRHIHALSPFPGAWCTIKGERVKLLRAQILESAGNPGEVLDDRLAIGCASGAIRPLELQRAGRPAMALGEFLRGFPVPKGTRAS